MDRTYSEGYGKYGKGHINYRTAEHATTITNLKAIKLNKERFHHSASTPLQEAKKHQHLKKLNKKKKTTRHRTRWQTL